MTFDLHGVEIFFNLCFLAFMVGAIAVLAREHAHQIYIIWYINTLFFVFFFCIGYAAETSNARLTEVCGSHEDACKNIYEMLTNLGKETDLLLFGLALALIPQLLTYLFCIPSGSASTPRYVSLVGTIAFWGLVKFVAGLGGILSANPFALLLAGKPVEVSELTSGFVHICMAFIFAAIYVTLTEKLPAFIRARSGKFGEAVNRFLTSIHKIASRHVPDMPQTPPHGLTRRALIELLKSDAVYDYITQVTQNTNPFNQCEPSQGSDEAR